MKHKKQAFELIQDICKLNNDIWGNKQHTYDASKAAALVIEEALEKLPLSDRLAAIIGCDNTPKSLARCIVDLTTGDNIDRSTNESVPPVGAFDASLDTIYIEVGNLHMQGLTPEQIVEGLQVVHGANLQKIGTKDSNGKVTKPKDFINPEDKLQELLDIVNARKS